MAIEIGVECVSVMFGYSAAPSMIPHTFTLSKGRLFPQRVEIAKIGADSEKNKPLSQPSSYRLIFPFNTIAQDNL